MLLYVVTLKDITNVQTEIAKPDDSLETVVASLKKIGGKLSDLHCQYSVYTFMLCHVHVLSYELI